MCAYGWCETNERLEALMRQTETAGSCLHAGPGIERRLLKRRVGSGLLCSPFPGLYARSALWRTLTPQSRALFVLRGAAELHPDWAFCGPSAAVAFGLEVSGLVPGVVHVVGVSSGSGMSGHVRYHALSGVEPVLAGNLRCTPFERTVADCVRSTDFPRALAVADSALRVTGWGRQDLERSYLVHARGRRGVRAGLLAVRWADPRSENGGESVARGVMLELGFVAPDLQVVVPNLVERGREYRVDFCWRGLDGRPIFGELDGRTKYVDPAMAPNGSVEVLSRERLRESRLTLANASILRFSFSDLRNREAFRRLLESYGVPYRLATGL